MSGWLRRTIFVEQVDTNGDESEDGGDEHQLLVDDLVVQVAEPHRLEKVTFVLLFEDQHFTW